MRRRDLTLTIERILGLLPRDRIEAIASAFPPAARLAAFRDIMPVEIAELVRASGG
ncbi:MAG TPA: hypothetical protein VN605_11300 [Thermoanaerobaculia bacterium]|nr:hypothetical protein [Thermoanaerobaculia bacterium]